jgi:alkaline phosphatase D
LGGGLTSDDLFFWTLPEDGYGRQLDFLLMSCHHPETKKYDGFDGFAVWHQIPEIIKTEQNANVRFAILAGDQIYADEVESKALNEDDPLKRQQFYLSVYRKFWENEHYRRVLCRIPAVMMWDDHDITDGWGSREDSFTSKTSREFKRDWKQLFGTAKQMFRIMQASRNPEPLSADFSGGFDSCFKVGKAGFVLADLRSHRNIRGGKTIEEGRIWDPAQLDAIKAWIAANRKQLHTLFFVSSVVFSHGAPSVEKYILRIWFWVIDLVNLAGQFYIFKKPLRWFNDKVGDLRDDINDSWGSDANKHEAEHALDFLFELENPSNGENPLNVVILSGDIHTPGYSTIYSSRKAHQEKAVIPHVVATPVAYEPFSWVGEAIFRHLTKVVALGNSGTYTSQVSHHFCYRNVVVVSLRNYETDESHLKVKYYLEEFPEPQVMLFDLNHGAHRENIHWRAVKKPKLSRRLVSWITKKPIPISFVDVDELPPASTDIPLPEKPMN